MRGLPPDFQALAAWPIVDIACGDRSERSQSKKTMYDGAATGCGGGTMACCGGSLHAANNNAAPTAAISDFSILAPLKIYSAKDATRFLPEGCKGPARICSNCAGAFPRGCSKENRRGAKVTTAELQQFRHEWHGDHHLDALRPHSLTGCRCLLPAMLYSCLASGERDEHGA